MLRALLAPVMRGQLSSLPVPAPAVAGGCSCHWRGLSSTGGPQPPPPGESGQGQAEQAPAQPAQPPVQQQQQHATLEGAALAHSRRTASGFTESFLATQHPGSSPTPGGPSTRDPGSSSEQQQPQQPQPALQERLRVQLRRVEKQAAEEVTVDPYSLSRSLVGEPSSSRSSPTSSLDAAAGASAQLQAQLGPADAAVLEKLVGILTKHGKKSKARRLLLDAMGIIKQQLAAGQRGAP